jgi:predicted permease
MRFYRVLLLLYPASFRAQYGRELESLFALRLRAASNPIALCLFWMETIKDVLTNALETHGDILTQDVKYAVRGFRRAPGFVATAVLVAAIGVGATTAAYTLTDYVLFRPLPFPESERLVKLWEDMSPSAYKEMEPSPANYRDWKRMSHSFAGMAASRGLDAALVGVGEPQQIEGAAVTADLFPMLGAQTVVGRIFSPNDDRPGAGGVAVLSYGLWQQRFGGDRGVLGRRILLDGKPFAVIGVMAKDFSYPQRNLALWTTMQFQNADFDDRNNNYLDVVAKLRPGYTIEQARAEMRIVSAQLKREYPRDNEHVAVAVEPLRDDVSDRSRLMLVALLGASFCVLLIACTNLANLLLARALVRRKEVAVRTALGAGRERLVRQMLTESLILALCGGALGVLLAMGAVPLFTKLVPGSLPISGAPAVDARVLLFALGLTVVTGVAFGVIPAGRAAGDTTATGLQEGSRQGVGGRKERLRSGLVVAEIAVSFVLLICSGLLIRALWQLEQTDPGFRSQHVLTMRTTLPMPKYETTPRRVKFYKQVLSEVRALPGVTSAAYMSFLPMVAHGGIWPVTLPGQPPNLDRAFHSASLRYATPGYFQTMGIPILRGRDISEADTAATRYAAVISASFAREYWPHEDPLGRQFDFGGSTRTVVGVVGNVRVRGLERESEPQVYLSYQQVSDGFLVWYAPKDLVIQSSLTSEQLLPAVRRIIAQADSQQPISDVATLQQIVEEDTAPRRVQVRVLAGFALIAIFLAGIGIHGLLSFTVSSRAQEFGVRIALGARTSNILGMVLRESGVLAFVGAVTGVGLGYLAGRALQSLLVGIDPGDLATYACGAALVICMTLAGSFVPALRAVRVDPMQAMRTE